LRTKLSVSVLAQRKIESPRPRKHGLFLRAEEKMRLYGRTLVRYRILSNPPVFDMYAMRVPRFSNWAGTRSYTVGPMCRILRVTDP
jgi:hypothetical protein